MYKSIHNGNAPKKFKELNPISTNLSLDILHYLNPLPCWHVLPLEQAACSSSLLFPPRLAVFPVSIRNNRSWQITQKDCKDFKAKGELQNKKSF